MESLAREYFRGEGFGSIFSEAATQINDLCRSTVERFLLDFPLEEYLYIELLFRFLDLESSYRKSYKLYRKV